MKNIAYILCLSAILNDLQGGKLNYGMFFLNPKPYVVVKKIDILPSEMFTDKNRGTEQDFVGYYTTTFDPTFDDNTDSTSEFPTTTGTVSKKN